MPVINGTVNDDGLNGTAGDDTINGLDGNDVLRGLGGNDIVNGDAGDDNIAGDGSYTYNGPSGDDTLNGGDGDDLMRGGAGVDTFNGGAGDDDRVSFYSLWATQAVYADLRTQTITNDGYGNAETMTGVEGLGAGTAFADTFHGNDAANTIIADVGDIAYGYGGDDNFFGGSAAALIDGGLGVDTISLQQGLVLLPDADADGAAEEVLATAGFTVNLLSGFYTEDTWGSFGTLVSIENVTGSEFDDFIVGDHGDNVLNGVGGADVIRGNGGNDTIDGGDGDDNLAGDGSYTYNGPSGDDAISGGAGDDLMRGGAGVDSFDGGDGADDRVSFYSLWATQAVYADLNTGVISNDGYGNVETMLNVEGLGAGTVFADTFIGNALANTLLGDTGDTVTANDGDDNIFIGGAPAIVDGGAGVDTLSLGQTTLQPDNNADGAAEEVIGDAGYTVDLQSGSIQDQWGGVGTLNSIENVNGTDFADNITGSDADNVINAGAGNDVVVGLGGNDTIDGGDGNDQLRGDGGPSYNGPSGNDTLIGGAGNDVMWGGAGVDSYDGGDGGNDRVSFFALAATQGASANLITQTISNDGFGNVETMTNVEGLGAGTAFVDTFIGNDAANFMYADFGDTTIGNGGDDIIYMARAPAVIDGGLGNDTIGFIGDTSGSVTPDTNADGLAEFIFATNGVYVDLLAQYVFDDGFGNEVAISGFENVDGSELGDTIIGEHGANFLNGWGGDDIIYGFGGDDVISGGEGSDQLRGDGSTSGVGPFGNDQIFGEGGDDYMNGGAGVDYFDGGDGADRVSFYNRSATQGAVASLITQTISNDGFGNAETMVSVEGLGAGTRFADQFTGDDNANFMYAGLGDTVLTNGGDDIIQVDSAALLLDGGSGVDTIQFVGDVNGMLIADNTGDGVADVLFATQGVNVNLLSNRIFDDGFGNTGQVFNIENVDGSLLDDVIQGNNGDNVLNGLDGADLIRGLGGNDTIDGGAGDDNLAGDGNAYYNGPSGDDAISGGDGDDLMRGGAGVDSFDGGVGDNDRVSFYSTWATQAVVANLITQTISNDGYGNAETMTRVEGLGAGTVFADTFIGNDAANTLLGDTGDTITANGGNDTISVGGAPAMVDGGAGVDTLQLNLGVTLQADADADGAAEEVASAAGYTVNLTTGTLADEWGGVGALASIENVDGSEFADNITGDNSDNVINGAGGSDIVLGLGGNDTIDGGAGNDQIRGDGGAAYNGPSGNDTLSGGDGNDTMWGGAGVDSFDGGAGADRVSFYALAATQGAVADLILQTISNDGFGNVETMISIENLGAGTAYADTFIGNDANNFMYAGFGDTTIGNGGDDIIYMDRAPAVIDGGLGNDTIGFIGDTTGSLTPDTTGDGLAETIFATSGVYVDLLAQYVYDDGFGNEVAIGSFENVEGSELGDTIIGEHGANFLNGWGGDDIIYGFGGDDVISGGEGSDQLRGDGSTSGVGPFGNDQIFGEGGDDYMNGGAGVDYFDGGDGADRVSFYNRSATQGAVASLITQTISNDGFGNAETMVSVEGLGAGTRFADQFTGDDNANFMYAGLGDTVLTNGGDDIIQVDSAALLLDGGSGVDTIQFVGDVNGMLIADNTGDGVADVLYAANGVDVSLRNNAIFDDGFGNFGSIQNIENVDGSLLDDFIQGNDGANVLQGLDGADVIYGWGGDDVINGGAGDDQLRDVTSGSLVASGNDTFNGGDGDDYMNGGGGVDTFDGGDGTDRVSFYSLSATQGVVANLMTQTISNDGYGNAETMVSVEGIGDGTAYADTFIGSDGANFILASIGDTVQANGGDDTFQLSGGPALIDGGAGIDTIQRFNGETGATLQIDNNGDGLAQIITATQGVNVDLRINRINNDGFGNIGTIQNVENVGGSTLNDVINGDNTVGNTLWGYEGNDTLAGNGGDDTLNGGAGNDTLSGGAGNDTATYADETDAMFVDLAAGTARRGSAAAAVEDTLATIENLIGGAGNDTLTGNNAVNILDGGAGDDTIRGAGASDTIRGGVGNDTVLYTIGDGADAIDGGADSDTLTVTGTAANNTLNVVFNGAALTTLESATLSGIETVTADLIGGTDTLTYGATTAAVAVALAAGSASGFAAIAGIENVTGGAGDDTISGDTNANVLNGGGGADTLSGGLGNDTLNGAGGTDTASYADEGADMFVDLAAGTARRGSAAAAVEDTLTSIENVTGGFGNDTITGSNAANVLSGGSGADTLRGAGGNDTIAGGAGNDIILYAIGEGVDAVDGGADTDTLNITGTNANNTLNVVWNGAAINSFEGGTVTGVEAINADLGLGTDTLNYGATTAAISIDFNVGLATGFGAIAGIENVVGGAGADIYVSGAGVTNRIEGAGGNDTYYVDSADTIVETVSGGVDAVFTTSANYTLANNVESLTFNGVGNFTGVGNSQDNVITGGAGNDTLSGGGGNDIINGGAGNDILNGGTGDDRFVYQAGFGADTVNGFDANPTGGQDLIDLSAMGITAANFAAHVVITDLGADTQITIDGVNTILLVGVNGSGTNIITQQDFILGGP